MLLAQEDCEFLNPQQVAESLQTHGRTCMRPCRAHAHAAGSRANARNSRCRRRRARFRPLAPPHRRSAQSALRACVWGLSRAAAMESGKRVFGKCGGSAMHGQVAGATSKNWAEGRGCLLVWVAASASAVRRQCCRRWAHLRAMPAACSARSVRMPPATLSGAASLGASSRARSTAPAAVSL